MRPLLVLLLVCLSIPAVAELTPADGPEQNLVLGTAFNYQGRLVLNSTPVDGNADIIISLWDAAVGGNQIGVDQDFAPHPVVDGLFSLELDFGAGAFAGDARWLEIQVRQPAGSGSYTTLSPRQEINAVPYALHALNGGGGGGGSGYWDLQGSWLINNSSTKVLINRNYTIGSEYFGIHAPTTSYGGMYISTDGDNGRPFYGYKAGASTSMWTYQDGATLEWRVFNGGDRRLVVHNDGKVGVGNTVTLDDNDDVNTGGSLELRKSDGTVGAKIWGAAGSGSQGGTLALYNDSDPIATVVLDGEYGNPGGGALLLRNQTGATTIELAADLNPGDRGLIRMYKPDGTKTIELDPNETGVVDQGATLKLYDDAGNLTIELDGDYGAGGEGRITTEVIEITGGADFSEQFDVSCGSAAPGSVVSIDPTSPGELCLSSSAYDRRVAGIISGAGGVKPGLLMGQRGTEADGQHPVALTGRVYCKVDASYGAIEPGDLLTTSPTTGHAMKVSDHSKATGAVLGKAMTSLESGRGLVLVLVSLQ